MCVALAAIDARVIIQGANGSRTIAFNDFHQLPGNTPQIETALRRGELITAIELPRNNFAKQSLYQKVRDRASYAFAVVSVAAALEVENNQIKTVRLALGGVAHKPWRASAAESILQGLPATEASFQRGAEAELKNAKGFAHNSFKIELVKRVMVGTLKELAEQRGTNS
jgi:xanthine dehydrogenase YagS FAD-binding subunit